MMSKRFVSTCSGLLLFLVVTTSAAAAEQPAPLNLPIKAALAMAISNNLDLRVDALDSARAETIYLQNRGIYDPFLNLSASHAQTFYTGESYGTNDTSTFLGVTQYLPTGGSVTASTQTGYSTPESDFPDENWTDWYTSVGVTLSQPLLKNFGKEATELNITLAANAHENSLEQFRLSVTDTVYAVIKAYNRLYTLRLINVSRQISLNNARKMLDKIKTEGKKRQLQAVEIANTEYVISQRLKDLVEVERLIKNQEAKLRYLIGMDRPVSIIPIDPPSTEEPQETTDQAVSLALAERSDLKQLQLDLESSELQERVAKQRLLPNLSVSAGGGFRGIDDRFNDSVGQIMDGKGRWWSAGLQFSVPLGNTVAENDYRRSSLKTSQMKYQLSALEWKIRDYIEEDMRSLLSARVQRQVAQRSVNIAEQRVQQYRKSVISNTSQVQDLLNAETDLIVARDGLGEAQEAFANGVALLWKDAGVLLERMNIHLDTRQPQTITAVDRQTDIEATKEPTVEAVEPPPIEDSSVPPSRPEPAAVEHNYILSLGTYFALELDDLTKKIVAAGMVPRVQQAGKQPRSVVRLQVGTYPNFRAAQEQRQQLEKTAGLKAFIIKQGPTAYRLYAGSYLNRKSAEMAQKRLREKGVEVTLEKATVRMPTSQLTAGDFADRKTAAAAAAKLKLLGIDAVVRKTD